MEKPASRRIFFALWPDDQTRNRIAGAFNKTPQSKLSGRCLAASNLHLTLHFLGNVSQEKFDCAMDAAEKVKINPFKLTLDHYDCFDKARIFWLGAENVSSHLISLHKELAVVLADCGYIAEKRPFNPHITLMRKISLPIEKQSSESIEWQVNQFALVESIAVENGVEYHPVKIFTAVD